MPDPFETSERSAARKFMREQQERWRQRDAEHRAGGHTMVDQLRNAIEARPFVPFQIHTSADKKEGIRIEKPDEIQSPGRNPNGEDDQVVVIRDRRGRWVYRIDAIQLLLIDAVSENASTPETTASSPPTAPPPPD